MTLAILKLDAIGDYLLFRNYIEIIKQSSKFKDFKITLIGNEAWKDLSLELDGENVDTFIWIDKKKMQDDVTYRKNKIRELTSHGYQIVIHPTYSREFINGDWIVRLLNSNNKISFEGDLSNTTKTEKLIGDLFYNLLISSSREIEFEFFRYRSFFESILNHRILLNKPLIKTLRNRTSQSVNKKAVLFIGANSESRKWSIQNFSKVAEFLAMEFNFEIILTGGKEDAQNSIEFYKYFNKSFINLVGKTTLTQLAKIISDSDLILTNETSAAHLAAALEIDNIFVISNTNHLKRFCPYPKSINSNYNLILPEGTFISDDLILKSNLPKYLAPSINGVTADFCIHQIRNSLKYKQNENN